MNLTPSNKAMKRLVDLALLALLFCCALSPVVRADAVDDKVKALVIDDAKRKLAGEPMDYISGEYCKLKDAGFSDAEIRNFMIPILAEAGFKEEQIRKYFKLYDPLYSGREIDRLKEQEESITHILN